jgi:beta-glucosidase
MMSKSYENHLKTLIEEKKFTEAQLDEMVKNILRVKFRLGLFENASYDKSKDILYAEAHLAAAKQAALESAVLLKNDNQILPISEEIKKLAVIGPLADAPLDQLGTWIFDGEKEHTVTPLAALKSSLGEEKVVYAPGLDFSRDRDTKGFALATKTASSADAILIFAGEEAILSGEAHSRANIDLPGAQEALIKQLALLNKPIILVIMAGRPLILDQVIDDVDAVLFALHPGTMGGPALADLILGEVSPSGRLPITWPKSEGTIPMYYNHKNTGRPAKAEKYVQMYDIPVGAWQSSLGNESHYLDEGYEPLFPFGFGLTYSEITYSNLQISANQLPMGGQMKVTVEISNQGKMDVQEVVQLYFQDKFASVTRPVKELLRFKKVLVKVGETQTVTFEFSTDDLKFYNIDGQWKTEPGDFNLWVGKDAASGLMSTFTVN